MKAETREELEQSLLGWMLAESHEVLEVEGVSPQLFAKEFHRVAAEIVLDRLCKGTVVTPGIIAEISQATGEPKAYLIHCVSQARNCVFPREYVKTLQIENQREELVKLFQAGIGKLHVDHEDPQKCVAEAVDGINEIMRQSSTVRMRSSRKVAEAVIESLKEAPPCYPTGIPRLDVAMDGGMFAGKAYGVAARKKVGKTTLAATISWNLDAAKVPHLYICAEMNDEEVMQRTLAGLAQVYPSNFRNRDKLTGPFLSRLATASFKLTDSAHFLNAPGITFDELKRVIPLAINRHGIKGVILDYWQLVGGKSKNQSDAAHLDEVAQWIADFGRKAGIWSLVMAQINQEGNTRGGEGIRLAFDQVYLLQPCNEDITDPGRWMEMLDTRYTKWINVGENHDPAMRINEYGPYMEATCKTT